MKILYLPNSYSQQRQKEKKANIYPVRLAMEAEWYRKQGHEVDWGNAIGRYDKIVSEPENLPFLSLPHPDRIFTRAKKYTSGNYKYLPGTHIMSASGCWWSKCTFCVENGKPYQVRPVEDMIEEIEECRKLGFREIFDDSATFPTGEWLEEFCNKIPRYTNLKLGCNMRIDAKVDYKMMREAGFRMLLFGIESNNQYTLDRINKGVKVEDIIPTIKKASEAGLEPHICVIFGYSWETDRDSINTLKLVHYLLWKGYTRTAQASFYTTQEKSNENQRKYVKKIYNVAFYPDFWWSQLRYVKDIDDIKYIWRGIKEGIKSWKN